MRTLDSHGTMAHSETRLENRRAGLRGDKPLLEERRRCGCRVSRDVGNIWVFPKIGVPQNGWFILENSIKLDDLGVPLFLETPIS